MFLSPEEIATLTGRKVKKLQCEQLRKMAIPFFINACGRPVVARSAVEGGNNSTDKKPERMVPAALRKAA